MKTHDYKKYAKSYAELGLTGTYYLAFRDIPLILHKYCRNAKQVLDFGCGTGRSLRFFRDLGFDNVVGVDISEDMIKEAKSFDPFGNYKLMKVGEIPFKDKTFDLIFSSFVFLEISEMSEMIKTFKELKRVLKNDGKIVFITSIVTDIKDQWLSGSYDFEDNNKPLNHCQKLKLLIKDKNIILYDYNWTIEEYKYAIEQADLQVKEIHTPIGTNNDPYNWLDEKDKAYYYIFILESK